MNHLCNFLHFFFITPIVFYFTCPTRADVVTLKDGNTLICEIVEEETRDGNTYLKIRANQSLVWIDMEMIEQTEIKPLPDEISPEEIAAIVSRLQKAGTLFTQSPVQPIPDSTPTESLKIVAADVRGWAYLYEDLYARNNKNRKALQAGDALPLGQFLKVSPNSRVTLALDGTVQLGLAENTQIRFDLVSRNRSTFQVDIRLETGAVWMKLNAEGLGIRSFIYKVNLIRTVLRQDTTLYSESGAKTGAVDITYLFGRENINFWRASNDRYLVKPGDFLPVSPDTTQPKIEPNARLPILQQKVNGWEAWKPEPLLMQLGQVIPPLETYPPYGTIPALYPYKIPIDHTMLLPPETHSMGEIIALYKEGLKEFRQDTGHYPTRDQGLKVLTIQDRTLGWDGPYVPLSIPRRDLWGGEFVYEVIEDQGKVYVDVRSMGPNQKDDKGLEDDIR